MKRGIAIGCVAASWCLVCWMHWRTSVVVIPDWSLALEGREVRWTGSGSDDAVVLGAENDANRLVGPVEVVLPGENPRIIRALEPGDEVLRLKNHDARLAIVRRGERLCVMNLHENRQVSDLGEFPAMLKAVLADEGRVVLVETVDELVGVEVSTGQRLWQLSDTVVGLEDGWRAFDEEMGRYAGVAPPIPIASLPPGFVLPRGVASARLHRSAKVLIDVTTGKTPEWLAERPAVRSIRASPCGRFALVTLDRSRGEMIEIATGEKLWDVSFAGSTRATIEFLRFSADGTELQGTFHQPKVSNVWTARWDSATGRVIEPTPATGIMSSTGVDRPTAGLNVRAADRGWIGQALDWAEKQLGQTRASAMSTRYAIVDIASSRELGRITASFDDLMDRAPKGVGVGLDSLLIQTRVSLDCYRLPLRRDWARLAAWCFVPLFVLGFVFVVIRQIREQYRSGISVGDEMPATSTEGDV